MPPPTRQTFGAGTLDTGGASRPRTSCRCVPSPAQYPPIVGGRRRRESVPVVRAGDAEAGNKHGPALAGVKQRVVGMVLGALGDGVVEVGNGLQGDPKLGDEGVHEEDIGGDDTVIGGQRSGALDGLNAAGDQVGRAHVVGTEEAFQSGAACAWRGFEGGPAAEDVAKDRGIFLGKPWQDLWQGVCERTGQAMGQTDGSPTRRRRCSTRCAKARMVGLWGLRGVSLSRCLRRIATWSAASVGSSVARLGVNAARYVATVSGLPGKSTRQSSVRSADTMGPFVSSRHTATGCPWHRVRRVWTQA